MKRDLVAVLHGAVSDDAAEDEQDTLVQATAVRRALTGLGFRCELVALDLDLGAAQRTLRKLRPVLVFNLVDSVGGSGRLIHVAPALLEELSLPYTGAGLDAVFLTSNKRCAKERMAAAGLPVPAAYDPRKPAIGPWLVKSVWEHASIGIDDESILDEHAAVRRRIAERRRSWGGEWFAERYIDGREFNVGLLTGPSGWEILPVAEIRFDGFPSDKPHIVGYAAKWNVDSFEYRNTPRRYDFPATDRGLLRRLRELSLACATLFDLRGYARVDFRVDRDGRPWILEVNTNPCLSPDAGFAAAAERAGLSLIEVVRRIVDVARRPIASRHPQEDEGRDRTAGTRNQPAERAIAIQ